MVSDERNVFAVSFLNHPFAAKKLAKLNETDVKLLYDMIFLTMDNIRRKYREPLLPKEYTPQMLNEITRYNSRCSTLASRMTAELYLIDPLNFDWSADRISQQQDWYSYASYEPYDLESTDNIERRL